MSLRKAYNDAQAIRQAAKTPKGPELVSQQGVTRMVLVVRDREGAIRFDDGFPEDLRRELVAKLQEN